ncbi:four helix bundle protein [Gracilimonas amylolytica]|uniref:four helix bundle protein n=1 Tax=Gracilimonas amylolytica TaxID=1749045 RepID=UPI000CD9E620|nr:four helix bundle protein [Gracilimonas amylolytica]
MNKVDLENRLIKFSVLIIKILDDIPSTKAGNHLSGQLVRSGTSPALNYGEARSAESLKDFIHKLQVILKELRESFVCLRIIHHSKLYTTDQYLLEGLKESNELISIFVKSVQTSRKKLHQNINR